MNYTIEPVIKRYFFIFRYGGVIKYFFLNETMSYAKPLIICYAGLCFHINDLPVELLTRNISKHL